MKGASSFTPEELALGQKTLARELEALRDGMDQHRSQLIQSLERGVADPMREAFARAGETHARLVGGMKEEESGPSSSILTRGARIERYREGVREEVLEPLREVLKSLDPGQRIWERWEGFQNGLPGLAGDLSETVCREEPTDLYESKTGDGWFTGLRKWATRSRRGLHGILWDLSNRARALLKHPGVPQPPRVQRVALRSTAQSCLLGRCPLAMADIHESLQQHYGKPLARLEWAVADWTRDWFEEEEAAREAEAKLGSRFLEALGRGLPEAKTEESASTTQAKTSSGDSEAQRLVPHPFVPAPTVEPELPQPILETEEPHLPPSEEGGEEESSPEAPSPETVARGIQEALEAGAAFPPPASLSGRLEEVMAEEWDIFLGEIRVSDSFQESPPGEKARRQVDRNLSRNRERAEVWRRWHRHTQERLQLAILLLRLREGFDSAEQSLMGRVSEEALSPLVESWQEARAGLLAHAEGVRQAFGSPGQGGNLDAPARKVEALLEEVRPLVDPRLSEVLAATDPIRSVNRIADRVAGELADLVRYLPETLSVRPQPEKAEQILPGTPPRQVPFREIVLQTVDVLRLEAIRNAKEPLQEFLSGVSGECQEIPNILIYNLTAARDELQAPHEGPVDPVLEDALSLTEDGLARTAQGLEELILGLAPPWTEFTTTLHGLCRSSFQEIHARAIAEGAVQEQMLGLRSQLRAWTRLGSDRLEALGRWLRRRTSRTVRRTRVGVVGLLRRGRSAVGADASPAGEAERALEALRGVPSLLESLPLVYRRLYSFQPVSDPTLLVGREGEMEWVGKQLSAWEVGFGTPCLLTGPVAVGHTSLLNVLAATRMQEMDRVRLDLEGRIRDEVSLAHLLASSLTVVGDGPWTLASLGRQIMNARGKARLRAVLVEHLEHLILRVSGGTDLLERFLSFQSQTSKRIFWLSSTTGATWKLIRKSEPTATALVSHLSLSPLSRESLERLVMVRHRRSGLPLEFGQPADLNPLIRRRLRLSRGEKAKQEIIRAEFFDRLFRMSDGNISMAILLWLRSADFTSREGRLRIHPPRPIRLTLLEELDVNQSFALKAFLEHGSLTLEEYGEVFNASPEEAFQVFEALRSRMLLESMGTRGTLPSPPEVVVEGERYRIPGILSQAVGHRLKNQNILH